MEFVRVGLLLVGMSQTTPVFAADPVSPPVLKVRRNLAYRPAGKGDKRLTSLDVYHSVAGSGHPIVIYVHGGAWTVGDKRRVGLQPKALTKQGFTLVSINYRLFPKVTYREQTGDVASAIAWVGRHAGRFNSSADRIYLMGHSSGAHLAALVATDEHYLMAAGLPLSAIKGVVLLDGAGYDIPRQVDKLGGLFNRRMYRKVFGTDAALLEDASPITHVAKGKGIPPFLLIHVAIRHDSRLQAEGLATALKQAGVSATVFAAQGKTHSSLNRQLGQPHDLPTGAVFDFLNRLEKVKRNPTSR